MDTQDDKSLTTGWSRVATAFVVVLIGVLFLLRNFGIRLPFMGLHNWWALFILLGAVPSLGLAAQRYQRSGRVDLLVLHALLSAAAVIMVALFFLLELDWSMWWPLFVIYGGLWMLLGGRQRRAG
ncbi:MAG: LiaF transmembrane domain-containing protein [Bacillota bacterium]